MSLSRVPFLLVATLIIISPFKSRFWVACIVYTIAGITDFFDGWIARRYNFVTVAGIFLDALCDKVLNIGMFISFLVCGILPKSSLLLVLLCMSREFLITGMRLILASRKVVPADKGGKMKTATQTVSIGLFLLSKAIEGEGWERTAKAIWIVAFVLFVIGTVLSTWSGVHYVLANKAMLLE